ncbi:hypothetical protein predicted by Glimmer/Critica [Bdellovibrio bacteriovorus HD100]|uniref:Uncharacterized protein n=1 Tax=Bdellovibrio bacteriovorus (strain ATCC 15356 / DSM 50701 / NCIMB 9529 / HD100) TaxID=264462 RepID=Q6MHF4_BDEBA|nr:hypothetical protein predicted by Glimmer/Critica [Bdellovibrio bacteriovorus HD100]
MKCIFLRGSINLINLSGGLFSPILKITKGGHYGIA